MWQIGHVYCMFYVSIHYFRGTEARGVWWVSLGLKVKWLVDTSSSHINTHVSRQQALMHFCLSFRGFKGQEGSQGFQVLKESLWVSVQQGHVILLFNSRQLYISLLRHQGLPGVDGREGIPGMPGAKVENWLFCFTLIMWHFYIYEDKTTCLKAKLFKFSAVCFSRREVLGSQAYLEKLDFRGFLWVWPLTSNCDGWL